VIISHEHRFVFVKTRKTAGTSVEVFLERIAGEDAIVTPITPPVEGHRPRNYERPGNPFRALLWEAHVRRPGGSGSADRACYKNHLDARGIKKRIGARTWDSYFTFCFERNPWDKVVSDYYWRRGNGVLDASFRDFVLTRTLPSDFHLYSLDGRGVAVDFVGRYERLEDDLSVVLERLGIPTDGVSLTREKGNFRPDAEREPTRFDDDMSARIAKVFAREIAAFGYACPAHLGAS
jgi:hypothetical protein